MTEHEQSAVRVAGSPSRVQIQDEQETARTDRALDPVADASTRARDIHALEAHASALRGSIGRRPKQTRQSLLRLQRTHGNHYVQRVLALARKGDGESEVTPEVESAIERARGGGQGLESGVRMQM